MRQQAASTLTYILTCKQVAQLPAYFFVALSRETEDVVEPRLYGPIYGQFVLMDLLPQVCDTVLKVNNVTDLTHSHQWWKNNQ